MADDTSLFESAIDNALIGHTLMDFARDLARFHIIYLLEQKRLLEEACLIVEKEAKRVIGAYDYGWPQLKDTTQAERSRLGYPPNEPLLRTGELRDSITHEIEHGDTSYVGSPLKIARYQELGTQHMPPRSFLMGAAMAKEKEIHELTAEFAHKCVVKALGGMV